MSTEYSIVVDEFRAAFNYAKNKRIILYGTGKHTQKILASCSKDYNFIGLMDPNRIGEVLWNLKVFSPEELEQLQPDLIIIIARPVVVNIIYNRIEPFTSKLQIPVFMFNGTQVHKENYEDKRKNLYFELSIDSLRKKSEGYSIISFDIFDTLLMRKVLYPNDVFEILANKVSAELKGDFVEVRRGIQKKLSKKKYPTIDDIYIGIQNHYKLSDRERDEIKTIELDTERKLLIPRQDMIDFLNECLKKGKKVLLVSDMYLSSSFIYDILYNYGLSHGTIMYLSCEYSLGKEEGLFRIISETYDCRDVLHIGDDLFKDVAVPKMFGIETFSIKSALELLSMSIYSNLLIKADSLYKDSILGLLISKLFNSPFALSESGGKLRIANADFLGSILAPLVISYVFWTIGNAKNEKVDLICFVSRDGYLLSEIYEIIADSDLNFKLPKSEYIYISGRALSIASCMNFTDVERLAEEYSGTTTAFFSEVAQLTNLELNPNADLKKNINLYWEQILQKAADERIEYLKYLNNMKLSNCKKALYCDFFSKGTGQSNISKLVNSELVGNYLNKSLSSYCDRNKLKYFSLFQADNHYEKSYNVFKYYSLLEYIVSSPEPCLLKIIDNKPSFYREDRSFEGRRFMNEVQETIVEYCKELVGFLPHGPQIEDAMFEDEIIGIIGKSNICDAFIPRLETYEWFRGNIKEANIT